MFVVDTEEKYLVSLLLSLTRDEQLLITCRSARDVAVEQLTVLREAVSRASVLLSDSDIIDIVSLVSHPLEGLNGDLTV